MPRITDGKVFPGDEMTSRQRLLAAYRGEPVDRLPYWAKVTNDTWKSSQPEDVRRLGPWDLLDFICADGLFGCPPGVKSSCPHVSRETHEQDGRVTIVTHTPDGDLTEVWGHDPYTNSRHPLDFPIKTVEDVKRYRWGYTDCTHEPDDEQIRAGRKNVEAIGQRGMTKCGWGTSPLMHLVEHVVGPVNIHFMLTDHPEEMEELIGLMHADNLARAQAVARCTPADLVVSVENTSTSLISPMQFRQYCLPHLMDYGRAIEAEGKMHELHQCGLLYDLLPDIETIPASSIEAFTAPTLGNTRLADGRSRAPSKTLVGGTRVNTWLMSIEEIQQYVSKELEACPDHRRIVLTTAGVAPPACPAEKFRAIGQWLATVPVRT